MEAPSFSLVFGVCFGCRREKEAERHRHDFREQEGRYEARIKDLQENLRQCPPRVSLELPGEADSRPVPGNHSSAAFASPLGAEKKEGGGSLSGRIGPLFFFFHSIERRRGPGMSEAGRTPEPSVKLFDYFACSLHARVCCWRIDTGVGDACMWSFL